MPKDKRSMRSLFQEAIGPLGAEHVALMYALITKVEALENEVKHLKRVARRGKG